MPGTSPAPPKGAVPDSNSSDKNAPKPTPENPGGVHPQTDGKSQPAPHFQPPADPKTQNVSSSVKQTQVFENQFAAKDVLQKLHKAIDAALEATQTEQSSKGSELVQTLKRFKQEVERVSPVPKSKL